jgi:hypothetical protein
MADYSLALNVKPLQLEDPLTAYGRFATIQSAQNQNALAQYQLAAAQRAEEQQNALYQQAQNPGFKLDFGTAIKYGAPGIAAFKAQREAETNALQAEKLRGEVAAQPGAMAKTEAETKKFNEQVRESQTKALGVGLMQAMQNPDDNTLKNVFDRLDSTGVNTKPFRDQFSAIPDMAARKQIIEQYALAHPEGRQALEFVAPKPQTFNLGGREVSVDMNPRSPTFKQELLSQEKTATPGELLGATKLQSTPEGVVSIDPVTKKASFVLDDNGKPFKDVNAAQAAEAKRHAAVIEAQGAARIGQDAQRIALEKQRIAQAEFQAKQPKFDASAGGFVYAPNAENPQGKFVPVTGIDGKPLTEAQGNSVAYGMRMKEANSIFDKLASEGTERSAVGAGAQYGIGGIVNALPSALGGANPQQQQFQQAKLNFITAILRKESGAAIGQDEFEKEDQKYFRQVGDSDAVAAQKKQARQTAIKAMEIQAGPGAKEIQKFEPRTEQPQSVSAPKIGAVQDGYKFKGGDPSKPSSWEKL